MKCDELKFERLGDANETYPASTLVIRKQFVVAAIDELKREHHRERDEFIDCVNKLQRENSELKAMVTTDNSAVIERLSNENERLVKCCKEYDSRQRIDERIKFNGAQQLRATKRALWLARAAMCRTYDIRAYFIENPDSKRLFTDFFVLMQKAAATAAIKADEYK